MSPVLAKMRTKAGGEGGGGGGGGGLCASMGAIGCSKLRAVTCQFMCHLTLAGAKKLLPRITGAGRVPRLVLRCSTVFKYSQSYSSSKGEIVGSDASGTKGSAAEVRLAPREAGSMGLLPIRSLCSFALSRIWSHAITMAQVKWRANSRYATHLYLWCSSSVAHKGSIEGTLTARNYKDG